ncbi:MAG: glycosyltransferase family 2 protein [Verrucomicrobiota bacterium]|nr:glycosyltransferase family 2 protein [Verrucomicrobiota bacterium]
METGSLELSIVMPCLNEARTLARCIRRAQEFLTGHGISGEVIVADNGSTDGSVDIARELNVRVVLVNRPGYGSALAGGIEAAAGKYVIMGDSDLSYDFSALLPFVQKLREGYDLVMGNRYQGGISRGAMPLLHRYFGNPFLTALGRLFFACDDCGDFYCGLRGFRKQAVRGLELQSQGMEFALEMVVKAELHGLRITEVPIVLSPDGRDRAPHLRRYRDGWRSLRFYLVMSPRWFFGIPGIALLVVGLLVWAVLLPGPISVLSITFDYHTLLYSAAAIVLGYQSILLFAFAKLMAVETGLHPPSTRFRFLEDRKTLERFVISGLSLGLVGLVLGLGATSKWVETGLGELDSALANRLVICSVLFLLLGGQTVLAGFFFGLFNLLAVRRTQKHAVTQEAAAQLAGAERERSSTAEVKREQTTEARPFSSTAGRPV